MKNVTRRLTIFVPLLCGLFIASVHAEVDPLQLEARQLVKTFAGQLKPRLQKALQEAGPAHAIAVCAQAAPKIADELSAKSDWEIKRVSLKPRNLARAAPDAWERQTLMQFDAQLLEGKPINEMYAESSDEHRYRYLQPQAVEAVCLVCHGEKLAPEVEQALQKYAPGDQATGYTLGQIRGAFSLSKRFSKP